MDGFERRWRLEGIENFRDYGGYATASGRRMRRGRLFRSAHHGMATPADLERLDALGLHTLVDLRRPAERERMPARRGAAFRARVIHNDIVDEPEDMFHRLLIESDQSVEAMQDYLRVYYRKAPFEPRHIDLYRRYFQVLAEADGPVLIHCSAGKDRTGILVALTQRLLGVSEADVIADYLLTNDRERMERRAPFFAAWVQELTGRTPSQEAIFATMGVEAEYLAIAFQVIRAEHGSIEAYVEQVLGVDEALRRRIEARLLA
jgi:protein-tyrosine phosphatase